MRFISPKIDYAFKKISGSEQSKEILISFLNAIVYNGEKMIQDLTIVNPYNPGQILTLKDTYLDVKAVLKDESIVVIEMQVASMMQEQLTFVQLLAFRNHRVLIDHHD
jgi:predicted transposase/invertase (TIGR01784 family)